VIDVQLEFPVLMSTVVVPILGSLLLPLFGREESPEANATAATILLLWPLVAIAGLMATTGLKEPVIDPPVFSSTRAGTFTMILDGLNAPLAISIAVVTAFVAMYSLPYMKHRFEEMEHEGEKPPSWGVYYMLYVMFSAAMLGTVLSTNVLEFYLFLELSLLPSFLLIAFYGYGERAKIAILYLIWTHVGALLFLAGAMVLGLKTGIFDIINPATLQHYIALGERLPAAVRMPVAIALIVGLFVKMAVFGVHIWLPYAHAEASTPVSALLSPNLIGIAGYALVRISYTFFPKEFKAVSPYLTFLALLTMIYGGFMVLAQDDFKRLLAYSSISQMGYILLGVSSLLPSGIAGAMLHYASHAVGKALLFMTAGTLIVQLHGLRSISRMGGLAPRMPYTAALALIGFMHITGVPPSLGLWSEILIVMGAVNRAIESGSNYFIALVAGLLVAIGLSTAYAFVTMKRIFFGEPSKAAEEAKEAGRGIILPMALIAAMGMIFFLMPYKLVNPLVDLVTSLLR